MIGKTKYMEGSIIFVEAANKLIPVFAVYHSSKRCYPIVPGYASTIYKDMGQTLEYVTLVFDMWMLCPAVRYVALSRVSSLDNVVTLLRLRKSHFIKIEH